MSEELRGARGGDPLSLALLTVQDYEQWLVEYEEAGLAADGAMRWRRAQLRTLWAIAAEVRALRFVMEGEDAADNS